MTRYLLTLSAVVALGVSACASYSPEAAAELTIDRAIECDEVGFAEGVSVAICPDGAVISETNVSQHVIPAEISRLLAKRVLVDD